MNTNSPREVTIAKKARLINIFAVLLASRSPNLQFDEKLVPGLLTNAQYMIVSANAVVEGVR